MIEPRTRRVTTIGRTRHSCPVCGRILATRYHQQGCCDACLPLRDLDADARLKAKFLTRVDKHGPNPDYAPHLGPCWLWTGAISHDGYGRIYFDGRNRTAQRAACRVFGIEVPAGYNIDHLCRVRHCVNPDHFEIVTAQVNTNRGFGPSAINAAKTHCIRGHEFTPENTLIWKQYKSHGRVNRVCRECQRIRWIASKASA